MLRRLARDQLVHLLELLPGKKDLVIDPDLMRPLDRIAGALLLKQHGVDKIFKLEQGRLQVGAEQRFYLVRPRMTTMKYIADHINSDKMASKRRNYKIIFVPRKLYLCEMILEQEGVYGDVTFEEFHLDLIPLDRDILSLELPEFFPTYFLEGDQTWVHTVAKSLVNLQTLFGTIPNVYGQGKCAQMVMDLIKVLQENEGDGKSTTRNEIGHLVLLDRDVDYVTALASPVTYEGLLDEIFGIKSGFCEFDGEITGANKPTRLLLNYEDDIFEDIRNKHFSHVFSHLSTKAKQLQAGYDKRHHLDSINAMKTFVANDLKDLKQQHKSLAIHIGASEMIMKKKIAMDFEKQMKTEHNLLEGVDLKESYSYIEELICRQSFQYLAGMNAALLNIPLKLLCLLSLTQSGLPPKDYKFFKTLFLQSHGYEHLINFHKLKKLGLYTEQQSAAESSTIVDKMASLQKKSNFKIVSKKLALIPKIDDYDVRDPKDMGYVFSGAYIPLSCRLVEEVLFRSGWLGLEDVTKVLPGSNFAQIKAKSMKGKGGSSSSVPQPASLKTVLVYFLGGCTFAEIAALRLLGRIKGYRFVIATTAIINGNGLIESIVDKFDNMIKLDNPTTTEANKIT
ncbi:vacuolar protein sorting-associated protein 33B-like [Glandiceps talaboti]